MCRHTAHILQIIHVCNAILGNQSHIGSLVYSLETLPETPLNNTCYTVKPVLVTTSLYNTGYLCIVAMCYFSLEKVERDVCCRTYPKRPPVYSTVATFCFPWVAIIINRQVWLSFHSHGEGWPPDFDRPNLGLSIRHVSSLDLEVQQKITQASS